MQYIIYTKHITVHLSETLLILLYNKRHNKNSPRILSHIGYNVTELFCVCPCKRTISFMQKKINKIIVNLNSVIDKIVLQYLYIKQL